MSRGIHRAENYIVWLKDISMKDVSLVGGKNASLGEISAHLAKKGIRIPDGFAITTEAYWFFIERNGIMDAIKKELTKLNPTDLHEVSRVSKKIRALILDTPFSSELEATITDAYHALSREKGERATSLAVCSSPTVEGVLGANFSGLGESYFNIEGAREMLHAIKKCMASLWTSRAIVFHATHGFDQRGTALSVGVQQMIHGEGSGTVSTCDTESGFTGVLVITALSNQYYVFKEGIRKGKAAIIGRVVNIKAVKLSDFEIVQLAKWGMLIEDHFGTQQTIEWVKDSEEGEIFIVQSSPQINMLEQNPAVIESYQLKQGGEVIARGIAVGQKIGAGRVHVIHASSEMHTFKPGEVLVARATDFACEPMMFRAGGVITEEGDSLSHAARVSRELGIPCVVGVKGACSLLENSMPVTVSTTEGVEGKIYKGILPFEFQKTMLKELPFTKIKIMMRVGNPHHAFALSTVPSDGAVVDVSRISDINTISESVAQVAASLYPHEVVARVSHYKMLGTRYARECAAIKKARDEWGLTNIAVMIPACRTPEEGEQAQAALARHGLLRGKEGLKVYAMCTIPTNVVLARDFAELFDGISIDSPDMLHEAAERMITEVVSAAHALGKKVGMYGDTSNNHSGLTDFLVRIGIDSISLDPDAVVAARRQIAYTENTVGKTGRKTNMRMVGLLIGVGILAGTLMVAGAGCTNREKNLAGESPVLSPAEIREHAMEKARMDQEAAEEKQMTIFKETSFAAFTIAYPSAWSVEHWNGGVTFRDTKNGEYVSVFKQLVPYPVRQSEKQKLTINGLTFFQFVAPVASNGSKVTVVEVLLPGGDIMVIEGKSERFDVIATSFQLLPEESSSGRPATHWDVRERRLCVQMIVYARQKKGSACQAFPTPCDVPEGWEVCDAGDI